MASFSISEVSTEKISSTSAGEGRFHEESSNYWKRELDTGLLSIDALACGDGQVAAVTSPCALSFYQQLEGVSSVLLPSPAMH